MLFSNTWYWSLSSYLSVLQSGSAAASVAEAALAGSDHPYRVTRVKWRRRMGDTGTPGGGGEWVTLGYAGPGFFARMKGYCANSARMCGKALENCINSAKMGQSWPENPDF